MRSFQNRDKVSIVPGRWNLSPSQWEAILLDETAPGKIAAQLTSDNWLPWVQTLVDLTGDSQSTLDLGSGRGENSAVLALHGKTTTLLDWSKANLDFSRALFANLCLSGQFCRGDMTRGLPFRDSSFDTVFSCGVLEYFSRSVNDRILREAFRVAKRQVIVMIPNALSLSYRVGKWYMERAGKWIWGGEVPAYTLKRQFYSAGSMRTLEFSVGAKHALAFLTMPGGQVIERACVKFLKLKDHPKPSLFRQGYLLITAGDKVL